MTTGAAGVDTASSVAFVGGLVLPDGSLFGDAFPDNPWLVEVLQLCLASHEDGTPVWPQVWVELARGSGKTNLAAGCALVFALEQPKSHCVAIAADQDQSRLLLGALGGLIGRDARLSRAIRQTRNEFTFINGSRITVYATEPRSFFGLGASAMRVILVCDETCLWSGGEGRQMWHGAVSTLAKHPGNRLLSFSNAGLTGSWQQTARENVEKAGGKLYALPGCPATWVSESRLAEQEAALPPAIFARYWQNEWVQELGSAIEAGQWDAYRGPIPELDSETPVVVALDAATTGDHFAAVAVSRGDGEEPASEIVHYPAFSLLVPAETAPPEVWVRDVRVWQPTRGHPVDFGEVYEWLSAFVKSHNVVALPHDPWQLYDFCKRFGQEHSIWAPPFDQVSRRSISDTLLLQLIRSRRLRHSGEPELRQAALNASLRLSHEDMHGRLEKSHQSKKIDSLVSLSMAASQCLSLTI